MYGDLHPKFVRQFADVGSTIRFVVTASNPGGSGAKVSAGVNYAPWLIAPAPGGACFGGNVPTTAAQCKNGGWTTSVRSDGSTFKNQGDCMQYVNTGK
jgi:hypothetical protein